MDGNIFETVGAGITGFFGATKWNLRYIRVTNSCVWEDMVELLDEIVTLNGAFTRKRYVWNILRGKTFYKDITHYVTHITEDILKCDDKEKISTWTDKLGLIVHGVISSEKSEKARNSFVWGLTKKVPLLTLDTIPYMSSDRVKNILLGEKQVLNDTALEPFIQSIRELRTQTQQLTEIMEDLMGDG